MKKIYEGVEVGISSTPWGEMEECFLSSSWIDDKSFKVRKKPKKTNIVAILSGNILEVKEYEKPVFYNFESKATGKKKSDSKRRSDNLNVSKMKLRRLINSNIDINDKYNNKFVTFTFCDSVVGGDYKRCKDEWKKFIKRLKYYLKVDDLKWVYVMEVQHERLKKYGDKVWHFHCIFFNLPYVHFDDLNRLWGLGSTDIHCIDNIDNVGAYVVKYMQKDMIDTFGCGDLYGRSRGNLQEPIEIKDSELIGKLLLDFKKKNQAPVFQKVLDTDYYNNVVYTQYNYLR